MFTVLYIGVLTCLLADCGILKDEALRFPEPSVDNYVILKSAISEPMSSMSVCTWMKKFREPSQWHYFFSYAVPGMDNEILMSDQRRNLIGNQHLDVDDGFLLKNEWYHLCLTWSASSAMAEYYINGVRIKSWSNSHSIIRAGGILILGQDQDSLGGRFDVKQTFHGDIYQMNVFSRKLHQEEVGAMYYDGRCSELGSSVENDVVISWKDIKGAQRVGAIQTSSPECNSRSDHITLDKVRKLFSDGLEFLK